MLGVACVRSFRHHHNKAEPVPLPLSGLFFLPTCGEKTLLLSNTFPAPLMIGFLISSLYYLFSPLPPSRPSCHHHGYNAPESSRKMGTISWHACRVLPLARGHLLCVETTSPIAERGALQQEASRRGSRSLSHLQTLPSCGRGASGQRAPRHY